MKFKQSKHYVTLIIACLVLLLSNNAIGQKNIPLPKANQLTWQDAELTALMGKGIIRHTTGSIPLPIILFLIL
jgi:hypothetical protein